MRQKIVYLGCIFIVAIYTSVAAQSKPQPIAKNVEAKTSAPATALSKQFFTDLDTFINKEIKEWKVPGLSLAIVHQGKVLLAKGYGYRNLEKKLPVTSQTLFAIGSVTKNFTSTVLSILADRRKFDWDKPARDYLPEFELKDPLISLRITTRDLVTHRSGLPAHNLLWYNSSLSRKELILRLRYLELNQDLRIAPQYNNLMVMVAGYLAGKVAGLSWEDLVQREIFNPLGMRRSNFSVAKMQKTADFAFPYRVNKKKFEQIAFRSLDQIGPTGSINSNAEEMARYLLLHLNGGKVGQRQLVSSKSIAEMQRPQMVASDAHQEFGPKSVGLGCGVTTYRGHKLVSHVGGIDGFESYFGFMPQDHLGLVILTNTDNSSLYELVSRTIYDRLLKMDPIPWKERLRAEQKQQALEEKQAEKKVKIPRRIGTHPSHDLNDYTGRYVHPAYGTMKISLSKDNKLQMTYNNQTSSLNHFHYDIFEVPGKLKVNFFTNLRGDISSLAVPFEPAVSDIVFKHQSD